MTKKEYGLEIQNGVLVFINTKSGSEGGRFDTKMEAFETILEMVNNEKIDREHGLDLFSQIFLLDFAIDVIRDGLDIEETIKEQIKLQLHILFLFKVLKGKAEEDFKPRFEICGNCGEHGTVYISQEIIFETSNQLDAIVELEKLCTRGVLSLPDKERIIQEIEASELPIQSESSCSKPN